MNWEDRTQDANRICIHLLGLTLFLCCAHSDHTDHRRKHTEATELLISIIRPSYSALVSGRTARKKKAPEQNSHDARLPLPYP